MKIIINSLKYGPKEILIDEEDYEKFNKYKWHIVKKRNKFYVECNLYKNNKNKTIGLHRYLLNIKNCKKQIDHIDRNPLNNQKNNLRICNYSENNRNKEKGSRNKSGYKGVCWDKYYCKWKAYICINKKKISLGNFSSKEQAAKIYDKSVLKYFGEFGVLNFPKKS